MRFVVAFCCAMIVMAASAVAQPADVAANFESCAEQPTQSCFWALGDHLVSASGAAGDGGSSALDALSNCLADLTAECVESATARLQAQAERNAANPAAATMRNICLADPGSQCLMAFAMAYANTPFIGSIYETLVEQAFPFTSEGQVIFATQDGRNVSSGALSSANLMHMRWLLSKQDWQAASSFLGSAAFDRVTAATAAKLLSTAYAQIGSFDEAFTLAESLYTQDSDWADRFELVMHLMGSYAVAAPEQAPTLIEQLVGTTDQAAGFAGLATALANKGDLEAASTAFQRAMEGITLNSNASSRDEGLAVWAKELGDAGAFELGRDAVDAMESRLQTEWSAFDLAEAMFAADRQNEALDYLKLVAPDRGDYRYYDLSLALARSDIEAARVFVDEMAGTYQKYAAQGLARALLEAGRSSEAVAVSQQFGFTFGDSPNYDSDIPAFAASLASKGQVFEAVALAASAKLAVMAVAFAAIAVELSDGDWSEVVSLSNLD